MRFRTTIVGLLLMCAASSLVAETREQSRTMMRDLANLDFADLGNPITKWDHIPSPNASRENPHRLLVLLLDFPDRKFDRFAGEVNQESLLREYFSRQLFDKSYEREDTLSRYFQVMSQGQYHVQGTVIEPLTLSMSRAAYGRPVKPAGGLWRDDSMPEDMVEEAIQLLAASKPDFPWADFDQWDPNDHDSDGKFDEPDGYLDHFVIIFAGGGESSCNRLYGMREVLTENVGEEVLKTLTARESECVERIWPHRFVVQKREGKGPLVGNKRNNLGGSPINESLWARDYNMQSEYSGLGLFVHEFGHSIGLPDLYAGSSSNSVGNWAVMSYQKASLPQSLSAWSLMQLGWLQPHVVIPPSLGGVRRTEFHLTNLLDPGNGERSRAAMIVLPPKVQDISLGKFPDSSGRLVAYSGQGNDLNRSLEVALDLRAVEHEVILEFDAWWDIEAAWDFAYLEIKKLGSDEWIRRVPIRAALMSAEHGHDGKDSLPGFTGLSGDLDGDGKNESNSDCDPTKDLPTGEDKAGLDLNPCLVPSWITASFNLTDLVGSEIAVRLRYFTDGAVVNPGIAIDNLTIKGTEFIGEDFESAPAQVVLNGFSRASSDIRLQVPHYYILEYRDPYSSDSASVFYDKSLGDPVNAVYQDPESGKIHLVRARPRSGVVLWYFNGDFPWSENDPANNGPGKGSLLVVDANPNEFKLPGFEPHFIGKAAEFNTRYELTEKDSQEFLKSGYVATSCFTRSNNYLSKSIQGCPPRSSHLSQLRVDDRPLIYSYEKTNDYLPGPTWEKLVGVSELYDTKKSGENTGYRLRDRTLRHLHTMDAPFYYKDFTDGLVMYELIEGEFRRTGSQDFVGYSEFDDSVKSRWLNPNLKFGGVDVPSYGLNFEVIAPESGAEGAAVKISLEWKNTPHGE